MYMHTKTQKIIADREALRANEITPERGALAFFADCEKYRDSVTGYFRRHTTEFYKMYLAYANTKKIVTVGKHKFMALAEGHGFQKIPGKTRNFFHKQWDAPAKNMY